MRDQRKIFLFLTVNCLLIKRNFQNYYDSSPSPLMRGVARGARRPLAGQRPVRNQENREVSSAKGDEPFCALDSYFLAENLDETERIIRSVQENPQSLRKLVDEMVEEKMQKATAK
jgi:hypothetical protein